MVFAAGFGTRMKALTSERPKPLIHVAGRALLDHALGLAGPAGQRRIVVNAHYRAGMIADHLSGRPDIALSVERAAVLDTGGGLRAARPLLGPGPVLSLNSDAIWQGPNPLDLLEAAFAPARMDALLLLLHPPRALGHTGAGDFIRRPDGQLKRGAGLVFSGAQAMDPALLDALPDGPVSLNVAWDIAAQRGRLHGVVYPGRWCDVGYPEAIPLAEKMLLEGTDD
jgi:MurNAc alpha-1-phosphate uridylyltransferase